MNKKDLRVVKTEKAIKFAFIALIAKKGYKNIKIIEICEKAEINRNTFYLHYASKEDLTNSLITDLTNKFINDVELKNFQVLSYNESMMESMYNMILNNLLPNREVLKAIFEDDSMSGYLHKFTDAIRMTLMEHYDFNKLHSRIAIEYALTGINGVLRLWVMDNTLQIKDVAREISRLSIIMIRYAE